MRIRNNHTSNDVMPMISVEDLSKLGYPNIKIEKSTKLDGFIFRFYDKKTGKSMEYNLEASDSKALEGIKNGKWLGAPIDEVETAIVIDAAMKFNLVDSAYDFLMFKYGNKLVEVIDTDSDGKKNNG